MYVAMPITETKFKLRPPLRNMAPMTSASDYGAQRSCPKVLRASGPTGLEPFLRSPRGVRFFFYFILSRASLA